MIPFLDLRAAYLELKPQIDECVARVLDSGWYIGGEEVTAFEAGFAAYVEARHCVGVGNGLDALILALRALGMGGAMRRSCPPTPISPHGSLLARWVPRPVPVEPDPATCNIDPTRIEAASHRPDPGDPAGASVWPSADLDPILEIGRRRGLRRSRTRRKRMVRTIEGGGSGRMAMRCVGASIQARISARSGMPARSPPMTPILRLRYDSRELRVVPQVCE